MEVTQTSYFKLLAVGVCFSVISSSQAALLTGLRRIKDLALVNVASSCVSTLLGCAALAADATLGMIVFVLVGPISAALVGYLCARRLPKGDFRGSTSVLPSAVKLVRVGTGLMFTGLLAAGCELAQRVLIADAIGERSVGLFQAAWTVSMSYTSLLLNAMSADLYPRLASAANSPRTMRRLANEQAEMGILVGGPIFLLAIGLSPVLLEVLFSSEFYPAAGLLRLQAIGDLFKILAWPLGYLLLSGGANRQYIVAECGSLVCYLVTLFLLLPVLQLRAAGVAFICMYLVYLIVAYRAAHRLLGFEWDTRIKVQAALVVLAGSSCLVAAEESQWLCAVAGGFAATCFSLYSFRRLYALFRCPRPETPV